MILYFDLFPDMNLVAHMRRLDLVEWGLKAFVLGWLFGYVLDGLPMDADHGIIVVVLVTHERVEV